MSDMYNNPVQRGFFPDPSVVRVGDDYYMANSTFQYFPAIAISHSKDMIHCHVIGHAITDSEELDLMNFLRISNNWYLYSIISNFYYLENQNKQTISHALFQF